MLFEGFSAFFDEDGLTPIKAKKSEITERVRRQAAGVQLPSALKRGLDAPLMLYKNILFLGYLHGACLCGINVSDFAREGKP